MLSQPFRQRNRTLNPNRRSGRATLDHHSRHLYAHLNNLSRPTRSLNQHFPDCIAEILHKEDLDLRTRRALPSSHACGQHLRIVDHKEIAWLKKLRQLVDAAMGERTIERLQNEQPGVIAWEAWLSGNQQGIERKIEFGELH
jgi:hypothetical protein